LHSDSHCLHPHNMLGWLNQGGWGGHGMWHTEVKKKNACRLLLEKPEVKRPHWRPMGGW
jgi:hypothetical protein